MKTERSLAGKLEAQKRDRERKRRDQLTSEQLECVRSTERNYKKLKRQNMTETEKQEARKARMKKITPTVSKMDSYAAVAEYQFSFSVREPDIACQLTNLCSLSFSLNLHRILKQNAQRKRHACSSTHSTSPSDDESSDAPGECAECGKGLDATR